jgi:uncharacterized protein YqeY
MGMKDRLAQDLVQALKARDTQRKLSIRMLRAAILNEEKAGASQRELTEEEILGVISRQVRQRRESIKAYRQGGRQDLVDEETAQLNILLEYLPKQMSREELVAAAQQAIAEVGATGPKDMGQVMRCLMPRVKGRADGRTVNQIVQELLASASQE